MKKLILLVTICDLFFIASSMASESKDVQMPNDAFNHLAVSVNKLRPYDSVVLDDAQTQIIGQLKQQAKHLVQQPVYAPLVLETLALYKDQDSYPRQILIESILNARRYNSDDIPFLKEVFLKSIDFHYDHYPVRVRGWYTSRNIRYELADRILSITGQPDLMVNPDTELLGKNPAAWLRKYIP